MLCEPGNLTDAIFQLARLSIINMDVWNVALCVSPWIIKKKESESGLTEESNRTKAIMVLWKRHAVC